MQAIVLDGTGGPEALQRAEVPLGWPAGERDVLVRLQAAGLNPADAFFRQHGPYLDHGDPCVLGHDGAGIVEAVGPAVTRVAAGDAVCFCNGGVGAHPGTYAELRRLPRRSWSRNRPRSASRTRPPCRWSRSRPGRRCTSVRRSRPASMS